MFEIKLMKNKNVFQEVGVQITISKTETMIWDSDESSGYAYIKPIIKFRLWN